MNPYNLYPMNQWPVSSSEGTNMPSNNMALNPITSATAAVSGITSNASSNVSNLNSYMMNVPTDTTAMYGMMGNCPYQMMPGQENLAVAPLKRIITLSKSILHPPSPVAPPPTRLPKPPGCKTIFIGGLPEKITEEIIREAFEGYGEILTIRMIKNCFCHVRFAQEICVEKALHLSGYTMKIENKDDPSFSGRLHVDYARISDDEYEYEVNKHTVQLSTGEQLPFNPPTPPKIGPYSDQEVKVVTEKLSNETTFKEAVQILIAWLSRGECNKKNSNNFYYMIQSAKDHVQRLMIDKAKYEDELNKARMMLRQKMFGISLQFNDIEKVFEAAKLQKVWDHFTKGQRKSIELMMKQTSEIKKANWDELINDRIEDEMELSDEEPSDKDQEKTEQFNSLREQIDNLRNQLSAAQQEAEEVKKEEEEKVNVLRENFQYACQKLIESKQEAEDLRKLFQCENKDGSESTKNHPVVDSINHVEKICNTCECASDIVRFTDREARLISIIAAYLNVHPFPCSIDYIHSYLVQYDSMSTEDIENLMKQLPTVFDKEAEDIGSLQNKWFYVSNK